MRGSNTDADTAKTFRYTTAVREVNPADFRGTRLLHSRCFHLLASPSDAISQVDELRDTICRSRKGKGQEQPLVIWEPAPPSCLPKNLALCFEAARMVDIFSLDFETSGIYSDVRTYSVQHVDRLDLVQLPRSVAESSWLWQ
jgi:hypothetical protein